MSRLLSVRSKIADFGTHLKCRQFLFNSRVLYWVSSVFVIKAVRLIEGYRNEPERIANPPMENEPNHMNHNILRAGRPISLDRNRWY